MKTTAEEVSRILLWIVGGVASGAGVATPDPLFALLQPEVVGAAMLLVAAIWRALRPPVT